MIKDGNLEKHYTALVNGNVSDEEMELVNLYIKDEKRNIALIYNMSEEKNIKNAVFQILILLTGFHFFITFFIFNKFIYCN